MRQCVILALVFALTSVAQAEEAEPTKPAAPVAQPPARVGAIEARRLSFSSKVTALVRGTLVRGRKAVPWFVGLASGEVLGLDAAGKVVWRHKPMDAAVTRIARSNSGSLLAVASEKQLLVLDVAKPHLLWTAPAPIAFAFAADESHLRVVRTQGGLTEHAVQTGKLLRARTFQEKRRVEAACFSPDGTTVVIGVDDG